MTLKTMTSNHRLMGFLFSLIMIIGNPIGVFASDTSTTMSGTIGKYKVKMKLILHDNKTISGWYYYTSKGEKNKISLTGRYTEDWPSFEVKMDEKVNGKITGTFDVGLVHMLGGSGGRVFILDGDWISPTGKVLPVNLGE